MLFSHPDKIKKPMSLPSMNTPIIEVAKFDTILAQYEKIMSRPVFLSHLGPKKKTKTNFTIKNYEKK